MRRPAEGIRVAYDIHGQPRVTAPEACFLSAADRDGATVVAICAAPVGVDIEAREPAEPLPIDLLHASERRRLARMDRARRARAFARLWTAKEAYAKAFSRPIDTALALPTTSRRGRLVIGGASAEFRDFADRVAAVVVASAPP